MVPVMYICYHISQNMCTTRQRYDKLNILLEIDREVLSISCNYNNMVEILIDKRIVKSLQC